MPTHLVLFLGRANAGRTLMAEALVSRWGAPRLSAVSAGLEPGAVIDLGAALALRDELYATVPRPRLLSDLLATLDRKIDVVITLDPVADKLGVPDDPAVISWRVDDPRLHTSGEKDRLRAWRGVLRDLEERIRLLAFPLPQDRHDFLVRVRAQSGARGADQPASTRV